MLHDIDTKVGGAIRVCIPRDGAERLGAQAEGHFGFAVSRQGSAQPTRDLRFEAMALIGQSRARERQVKEPIFGGALLRGASSGSRRKLLGGRQSASFYAAKQSSTEA